MRPIILICTIILFGGCDRPKCTNTNPVFEQYAPNSNEYKSELIHQLKLRQPGDVHYWINKYEEIDRKPFMTIYIQADGLCAEGYLDIKNPNKLQKYKNVKGISYSGAELRGLQYAIDTINGKITFLFEEGKIID